MSEFIQQLINGVSLGSIYALIALGYTMVYGILRFINFAHSDIFMVGAFVSFYAAPTILKITSGNLFIAGPLAMIFSMIVCSALGVTIEKLAYKPLRSRPTIVVLITAIGVSFFLEYGGQLVFGPDPKPFPELIPKANVIDSGGVVVNSTPLIVIGTAIGLMLLLRWVVMNTKTGTAMRALSQNLEAARLMGINIDRIVSFTFVLGSSLAAAAAVLYASIYPSINPLMGVFPGLKAFIAAVVGGIGNLVGAALGGLIIGVTETFVTGYISPTYRDAIAFGILILILLFKPAGLLGKFESERV
ncbi:MAG TPA: branched-chain amino acid ABC transporter permease [candidate division Zixibacteria bacterium]|nr:branched-chain amino acid ABC transporter permease [candidate division Zixibacteria bacterium]